MAWAASPAVLPSGTLASRCCLQEGQSESTPEARPTPRGPQLSGLGCAEGWEGLVGSGPQLRARQAAAS